MIHWTPIRMSPFQLNPHPTIGIFSSRMAKIHKMDKISMSQPILFSFNNLPFTISKRKKLITINWKRSSTLIYLIGTKNNKSGVSLDAKKYKHNSLKKKKTNSKNLQHLLKDQLVIKSLFFPQLHLIKIFRRRKI